MTRQPKLPALPLSVMLGILTASGGSCLFVSLFSGVAIALSNGDQLAALVLKDFAFVYVFCTVYSAVFVAQKCKHEGGKSWDIAHTIFLLFFLVCYLIRFWPQSPQLVPAFTIRAFLWYGGSLAFCLVISHYAKHYYGRLASRSADSVSVLYKNRNYALISGVLVVILPLVVVGLTSTTFDMSLVFSSLPLVVVFLSSLIYSFSENANFAKSELVANLLTSWYPVAWCFLLLPLVFVIEKFLSTFYLEIFQISTIHLYSAILSFVFLLTAICSGAFVGSILSGARNKNSDR